MYFAIAALVIAIACSTITIRTLIGYSNLSLWIKIAISVIVLYGWFAPVIIGGAKNVSWISEANYILLSRSGYFLFGFVFFLFSILVLRDLLWYAYYGLAKLIGHASWSINPKNVSVLDRANFGVLLVTLLVSLYAVWNGIKSPEVVELTYTSPKVKEDLRIVQLSDMHINRTTSLRTISSWVNQINALHPDLILMTGDIVDDKIPSITKQLDILKGLQAKYGIYASIGNHELYAGINSWLAEFRRLGFKVLFNYGTFVGDSNVYVAGIPDMHTAMTSPALNANFEKALKGTTAQNYKILLSHNPDFADYITSVAFDLQLSGHTHGGQIFPFHLLVKNANNYLSGSYRVNGVNLYVSNGIGYWGPAMRILAPSNITLINLKAAPQ